MAEDKVFSLASQKHGGMHSSTTRCFSVETSFEKDT